ncbi:hypothetical protein [Amnibacterium setariae]|nr:hypothetical protein [Amnibacterium setariae]
MTAIEEVLRQLREERVERARALAETDQLIEGLEHRVDRFRLRETLKAPDDHGQAVADADDAGQEADAEPSGNRALVLSVFEGSPGQGLKTGDVYHALLRRGWTTKSADPRGFVSNLLSRMASEDFLERTGHGEYRLPGAESRVENGSERLVERDRLQFQPQVQAPVQPQLRASWQTPRVSA